MNTKFLLIEFSNNNKTYLNLLFNYYNNTKIFIYIELKDVPLCNSNKIEDPITAVYKKLKGKINFINIYKLIKKYKSRKNN